MRLKHIRFIQPVCHPTSILFPDADNKLLEVNCS